MSETTQTTTSRSTNALRSGGYSRGGGNSFRTGANNPTSPGSRRGSGANNTRGGAGARRSTSDVRPEFDQKTILVRRVTRVVAGGRRFSFSVAIVIGDHKGSVGVGIGKAGDTATAIQKAFNDAKKKMIRVLLTKTQSIPHEVSAKDSSARLMIRPNFGKGLVAGSSVRIVMEMAGIKDVTSKVLSPSRNKLNNARAAVSALKKVSQSAPIARSAK